MYSIVQRREKEKDSRYIQEASAPAAGPCIRPETSCASVTVGAGGLASDGYMMQVMYSGRDRVMISNVLVQSRRMSLRGETGPFTESHPQ